MAGNNAGSKKAKNNSAKKKTERSSIVLKTSENIGQVMIADDVVANIAALAALEVEGVGAAGLREHTGWRSYQIDVIRGYS